MPSAHDTDLAIGHERRRRERLVTLLVISLVLIGAVTLTLALRD